jgi:hypothetical protein
LIKCVLLLRPLLMCTAGRPPAHCTCTRAPSRSKAKPAAHSRAPSLTGNREAELALPYWMAVGQMVSSRLVALALAVSRRRTVTAGGGAGPQPTLTLPRQADPNH